MPKPYIAIALAASLVPAVAQAVERTPEGELRRIAANASMAYMNCRLDAQAAINAIRGKQAARLAILPGDSSKVSTCVAKAKEGVYDHIPEMNALISAHRGAAGLIKDWYESLIGAMDRLTVDVANLRDSVDAVPELGSKLERAASELR